MGYLSNFMTSVLSGFTGVVDYVAPPVSTGTNDLTSPWNTINPWNDLESLYNNLIGIYNDLTITIQNYPGSGNEWNNL